MPCFVSRRPNNHHHSIGKKSDGLETRLSMVPACVLYRNRWTGEDDQRIRKIQTSLALSAA